VRFDRGSFWFRCNRDVDFGTLLQAHFIAVLVRKIVFDTELFIEVIGPFDGDLRFFRFAGMRRFSDFFDSPGRVALGFGVMGSP
jgi:hypothetical protein